MNTNEAQVRLALQTVLASVLALSGHWGFAVAMLITLLPWKSILAAGGYLAQPLADWWFETAEGCQAKDNATCERTFDLPLVPPRPASIGAVPADLVTMPVLESLDLSPLPQPLESLKKIAAGKAFQNTALAPDDLSASLTIQPAIRHDVQTLPPGVLSNMDLDIERVNVRDGTAEAIVRFKSPNVTALVIRQKYILRKSGDQWQVILRQPLSAAAKVQSPSL